MADRLERMNYPSYAAPRPETAPPQEIQRHFVREVFRALSVLPAVIALLGLAVISFWAFWAKHRFVDRCMAVTQAAEARNEHEAALFGYLRLNNLVTAQQDFQYGLAIASERCGQPARTERLMRLLTPETGAGHPSARLWRAQRLLAEPLASTADRHEAQRQVALVLAMQPTNLVARALSCRICLDDGRLSQAVADLESIPVGLYPELRVRLAKSLCDIAEVDAALPWASEAAAVLSEHVDAEPTNWKVRISLAEAQSIQGRHLDAVRTIEACVGEIIPAERAAVLGGIYLAWARSLNDDDAEHRQEQRTRIDQALDQLKLADVDDVRVVHRLIAAQLLKGEFEQATETLRAASDEPAFVLWHGARDRIAMGDDAGAQILAVEAAESLEMAVKNRPEAEVSRIQAAQALVFLGRHESAVNLLEAGITKAHERLLRQAAVKSLLAWYDSIAPSAAVETRSSLISLLKRAHRWLPWELAVIERWDTQRARWKEEPTVVENVWNDLLGVDKPPLEIVVVLGRRAKQRGEYERALALLGDAYRRVPARLDVANDLAWVLAHHPQPDLARALEIVTEAIHQNETASALFTRGVLYGKLANWSAARRDLEAAQKELQGMPEFHAALESVYEALNESELAREQHRFGQTKQPITSPKASR